MGTSWALGVVTNELSRNVFLNIKHIALCLSLPPLYSCPPRIYFFVSKHYSKWPTYYLKISVAIYMLAVMNKLTP